MAKFSEIEITFKKHVNQPVINAVQKRRLKKTRKTVLLRRKINHEEGYGKKGNNERKENMKIWSPLYER